MTVMETTNAVCERFEAANARKSSVDALERDAGTGDELVAVSRVLRHASDYLYLQLEPSWPSSDFAAVDLLDDLRAEMGML